MLAGFKGQSATLQRWRHHPHGCPGPSLNAARVASAFSLLPQCEGIQPEAQRQERGGGGWRSFHCADGAAGAHGVGTH